MSEQESAGRADRAAEHADEAYKNGTSAVDQPEELVTRIGSEGFDIEGVHFSIDVELDPEPPSPGPE